MSTLRLFHSARSVLLLPDRVADTLADRLGSESLHALLHYLPLRVRERALVTTLAPEMETKEVFVRVRVINMQSPARKGAPWRATVSLLDDPEQQLVLVWFIARGGWVADRFALGTRHTIGGKLELFGPEWRITHPDPILSADAHLPAVAHDTVYTRIGGLETKHLVPLITRALGVFDEAAKPLAEWHHPSLIGMHRLPSFVEAVHRMHHPQSNDDLALQAPAVMRLACDEFLSYQLALRILKDRHEQAAGRASHGTGHFQAALIKELPFSLTESQGRTCKEIAADIADSKRMVRLLQGDVGSGKTLVALMTMLQVVEDKGQAALMAPTEILARQHHETLNKWLFRIGLHAELLTGSVKGRARKGVLGRLVNGSAPIIIGTHALFSEEVVYHDLRYAVIDEQHRFGVRQRMELVNKGKAVDVLLMTATPIPRSYLQVFYGELPTSRLTEKPPGRLPIVTRLVSTDRLTELFSGLSRQIKKGEQVFWVCPAIEDSNFLSAAETRHAHLQHVFGEDMVTLVHGKMTPREKAANMKKFAAQKVPILVATTVIEVGVDVPSATVMVIEQAERFGLSQLHQLRGRVGRGAEAAYCILLFGGGEKSSHDTNGNASSSRAGNYGDGHGGDSGGAGRPSENARKRLLLLRETEDGFRIAEADLNWRGAGELMGTKQSGQVDFRYFDIQHHQDVVDSIMLHVASRKKVDPTDPSLAFLLHFFDHAQ
ncbi:MAG: ATP-dependent DNA helicase RecG, partial [Alphaproteobacteria bacterium]|nr:ATP-dependent DNA helicase RecG [Alphaproteobacteria bacterium]